MRRRLPSRSAPSPTLGKLLWTASLLVVAVAVTLCDTAVQASVMTRTATLVVPSRAVSLDVSPTTIALLPLRRPEAYPRVSLTLTLANGTFRFGASDCKTRLDSTSAVVSNTAGVDWVASLSPATAFSGATGSATASVTFAPTPAFASSSDAAFTITIPGACVSTGVAASGGFLVQVDSSTSTAGLFTFMALFAATINIFALIGGSYFAYVAVQLCALFVSSGCVPLALQVESYVVGFAVTPLPFAKSLERPHFTAAAVALGVFVAAVALDALLLAYHIHSTPQYAPRLRAALRGRRDAFESSFKPDPDDPIQQQALPTEDVPCKPLPGFCFTRAHAAFGAGSLFHAARLIAFEATDYGDYAVAAIAILVWIAVFFLVVTLARSKCFYYKPYAATKSKLPTWLAPEGCCGPNVMRLSLGVFVEDFRYGMRALAPAPVFFIGFVAVLIGASGGSENSCRSASWILWFAIAAAGAALYRTAPYRSVALNRGHLASLFLLLVTATIHIICGADQADAQSAALIVVALALILTGGMHLTVCGWETAGGAAFRVVRYSDVTGGADAASARTFNAAVNTIVEEMRSLFKRGGGQPLDADEFDLDRLNAGRGGAEPGKGADSAHNTAVGASAFAAHVSTAPTLAQYLLSDFDALPGETQQSLVTNDRLLLHRPGASLL